MSTIDFDGILSHIGECGRYQRLMYYLLCIPATVPAAWLAFSQVFISASPDHWCSVPMLDNTNLTIRQKKTLSLPLIQKDGTERYSHCAMYNINYTGLYESMGSWPGQPNTSWPVSSCQYGWTYDRSTYDRTLVTELNLVCEDDWWPSTCTTLFYVGSLFGNVFFGFVADRWGRRTSFFIILFVEVTLAICMAFSPDYTVYTVLRTISGFTFPALFQIPFILTLEMMGPSYRTFAGMVICVFFAMAMMLLAALAFLLRDWFKLALATSAPFVILFSYWWIVPESPRWLLTKNRVDDAEKIVQTIAKYNRVKIPRNFLRKIQMEEMPQNSVPLESKPPETATPLDLLRYPNIRKKFLIIAFNWLANAVVYNGMSYNATNLGVNDYLSFFISAAVEVPSYFLAWFAMDRCGRRWVLCTTMMVGGLACISCMFVTKEAVWVTVSLAMIGKFGIAGSFAVIYVFASELLPTVLRSQAMGIASFLSGIGLIAVPKIVHLAVYIRVLPLIIMGALSVAGATAAIWLPETLFANLPQTLEEAEAFGTSFKLLSCPRKKRQRVSKIQRNTPELINTKDMVNDLPDSMGETVM